MTHEEVHKRIDAVQEALCEMYEAYEKVEYQLYGWLRDLEVDSTCARCNGKHRHFRTVKN